MTDFMRKSFNVSSPGTKQYADSHTRIFNCPLNPEVLKSKCEHCKAEAKKENGDAGT